MPSNKRFLAPGFLNRFDKWLLTNKPDTWSARTHLVLYYCGGFLAILALLAFIFPDDPRTDSGVFNWILFTSIITLIALVVWLIYLLRFNVFKRFGVTKPIDRLKTFLLYFISVGIIILISFVESGIECIKANRVFGDNEMVKDLNNMNMMITQLEYDSLNHKWGRDTFRIVDTIPGVSYQPSPSSDDNVADVVTEVTVSASDNPKSIRFMDTATLHKSLRDGDSTYEIDDSTFIIFNCPNYIFLNNYRFEQFATIKQYGSVEVYREVVQNYKLPDKAKLNAEMKELIRKYSNPEYDYYYNNERRDFEYQLQKKYGINEVESGMRNISGRKLFWRGTGLEIIIRLFFYITLSISLLVFIFRHSTVKTFFLTILTVCVISILTALFLALGSSKISGFFITLIFYFVVFTAVALLAWQSKTRNVVVGICINLFVAMLTFMPLIVVAFAYAVYDQSKPYNKVIEDNRYAWLFAAEIVGPIILLIALLTLIHKMYRRWYALPED